MVLLGAFLAGVIVGGVFLYFKGRRDAFQEIADEAMADTKRKEELEQKKADRKSKKYLTYI
jgi:hypothetical protein